MYGASGTGRPGRGKGKKRENELGVEVHIYPIFGLNDKGKQRGRREGESLYWAEGEPGVKGEKEKKGNRHLASYSVCFLLRCAEEAERMVDGGKGGKKRRIPCR